MNIIESVSFIEKYQKYYFESSKNAPSELGLSNIKGLPYKAEEYIVRHLYNGNYDVEAFAWKNGKIKGSDGEKIDYCECFDKGNCYKGERKIEISKQDFHVIIEKNKDIEESLDSMDLMDNSIEQDTFYNMFEKIFRKAILKVDTFGTVNIINQIFFVSKGKLPIFDQFAYKAVYALKKRLIPSEVHINTYADKTSIRSVATMYYNYIKIINEVFPDRRELINSRINDNYDDVDGNEPYSVFIPSDVSI